MSIVSQLQGKFFYVDEICTERHFGTVVMEAIKDLKSVAPVIKPSFSGEARKSCRWILFKMKKN